MVNIIFDPNTIVVKVNVPVEFKVKKTGGYTPHDIVVKAPEAGIDFAVSLDKAPRSSIHPESRREISDVLQQEASLRKKPPGPRHGRR